MYDCAVKLQRQIPGQGVQIALILLLCVSRELPGLARSGAHEGLAEGRGAGLAVPVTPAHTGLGQLQTDLKHVNAGWVGIVNLVMS